MQPFHHQAENMTNHCTFGWSIEPLCSNINGKEEHLLLTTQDIFAAELPIHLSQLDYGSEPPMTLLPLMSDQV